MIGFLMFLFDISLYYTLSSIFLFVLTESSPSLFGIPTLILSYLSYIFFKAHFNYPIKFARNGKKSINLFVIISCLIPAIFFLTNPALAQIIQFFPAWIIIICIFLFDRTDIDRAAFKKHASMTSRFFLLLFLLFVEMGRLEEILIVAVPYFIVYLLICVTLLRMLRSDNRSSKKRNIILMLIVLSSGIILAIAEVGYIIAEIFGFIQQIVYWVIIALSVAIIYIVEFIFNIIIWILDLFLPRAAPDFFDDLSVPYDEGAGAVQLVQPIIADVPMWLQVLVALSIILVLVLFFIYLRNRFKTSKLHTKVLSASRIEETVLSKTSLRKRKGRKLLRPSNPRYAIRWYYQKYMTEGVKRSSSQVLSADTTIKIHEKFGKSFPSDEASQLRELYIKARYQYSEETTKSYVKKASELWNKLK